MFRFFSVCILTIAIVLCCNLPVQAQPGEITQSWWPPATCDSSVGFPYYQDYYILPGQAFFMTVFIESDFPQATAQYNLTFPDDDNPMMCYVPDSPMNPYTVCGNLMSEVRVNSLMSFWNDRSENCNQRWGYGSSYQYWNNNFSVGEIRYINSNVQADLLLDSVNFVIRDDYDYFRMFTIDRIRCDFDGDGDHDWDDVDATDSIQITRDYGPFFVEGGRNPASVVTVASNNASIDGYLSALKLTNPNHPMIQGLHLGELMSAQYQDGGTIIQRLPASIDIYGRITAPGAQVITISGMILNADSTFQLWSSGTWSPDGFIDIDLPPNLIAETVRIEAVAWMNTLDYEENISILPSEYSLGQNYPNPFNPTTTIPFDLQRAAPVTLKVFNISGQLVAEVLNQQVMEAGHHQINFDGRQLASGMYIYTISAGNFHASQKMVLMK